MARTSTAPLWKGRIPFHPWVYFGVFLAALSILSFVSLPYPFQLGLVWIGLFLPLGLGFLAQAQEGNKKGSRNAWIRDPWKVPPGFWVLFICLFLATRFYRLGSYPSWPLSDEGLFSFTAMGLMRKWQWALLLGPSQNEPLVFWLLSLFFRIAGPSLMSLRLFTVLFSLAGAVAAYGAARFFLSPRLSLVFGWFFSLSFWEIATARQCTPNDLIPFFQLAAFILLGVYWKSAGRKSSWFWITALGLWCGAGFYAYTNWAVVWLFVGLALGAKAPRKEMPKAGLFTVLSLGMAVPLAWARLAPGGLAHIQGSFEGVAPARSLGLYLKGLLWDGKDSFPLGPLQGGYLDVVTGALAFTGLLYILRRVGKKKLVLGAAGFLLALLPGVLTNAMELQRVTPVLAFLILLATFGVQSLTEGIPPHFRQGALAGLLLVPAVLNGCQFFGPYGDIRVPPPTQQWRNVQYHDAYRILEDLDLREGPLYVFSEFNTDYDNKTLDLADYPFNAAENPSLAAAKPRWAALIANANYAPFLVRQFPGLQWKVLPTDKTGPDDPKPFAVFLIPTSQITDPRLELWLKADRIYRDVDFGLQNRRRNQLWAGFLGAEGSLAGLSQGDRFLAAVYWEKTGFLKFLDGYFYQATDAYRKAVGEGIPAAHLYYDLGVCLQIENKPAEAKENFAKAEALAEGKN